MKGRILLALLAFGAISLLAGCASSGGPERDINDPNNSLVFGYIDMEDAPTDMTYAHLKQVFPATEFPYWPMGVEDGLILQQYLPPGGYQLSNFGGSGFLSGEHEYSFPNFGKNATAVRIDEPGIYFIGAFKYKEVDTGFFEQGKFDMERISSPSERELLQRISEMDWVKGTAWESRIRKRLAELAK